MEVFIGISVSEVLLPDKKQLFRKSTLPRARQNTTEAKQPNAQF